MASVVLAVGGRRYEIACRDGEERHLQDLATVVDGKAREAGRGLGTTNETRQLLMAALLLADDLLDAQRRATAPAGEAMPDVDDVTAGLAEALDILASRVESLADTLENGTPTA